MSVVDPDLAERIWSMHCLRKPVSYIAAKLDLTDEQVRSVIRLYWRNME